MFVNDVVLPASLQLAVFSDLVVFAREQYDAKPNSATMIVEKAEPINLAQRPSAGLECFDLLDVIEHQIDSSDPRLAASESFL